MQPLLHLVTQHLVTLLGSLKPCCVDEVKGRFGVLVPQACPVIAVEFNGKCLEYHGDLRLVAFNWGLLCKRNSN